MINSPANSPISSNTRFMPAAVTGGPKLILRFEGLAVLSAASFFYSQHALGWIWFAILFLTPDFSMLGYLLNRKIGAMLYNAGHSYLLPIAMLCASQYFAADVGTSLSLIWLGHIGFDRAVGYGLKYQSGFKHTHLGTPFSNAR